MITRRRILALSLAAAVFFVVLFSSVFPSVQSHHVCTHHHCSTCEQILLCEQTVHSLGDVAFFVAVLFVWVLFRFLCPSVFVEGKRIESLVTLKVKLSH